MSIENMIGKTLTSVIGMEEGSGAIIFITECGRIYKMYHRSGGTEAVSLEELYGDVADILGAPITLAEERDNVTPEPKLDPDTYQDVSFTWTFYRIETPKGGVDLRWYGTSNGFYSEEVDFEEINTMNGYYYTASLATAAAAIEQGFEGCESLNNETWDDGLWFWRYAQNEIWRFPKTPHNVGLMEAKEGDFVVAQGNVGKAYKFEPCYGRESLSPYSKDCFFTVFWSGNEVETEYESATDVIIHRNNKPFPVWVNN